MENFSLCQTSFPLSENSLNESFVTDSLGLSFESENSWDMMDHEPGPDIPVKETKV